MAARLAGALACLALGAPAAEEGRRRFPDDEVVASQRYFSRAWRDHFNARDAEYCASAYLEESSLHAALGPSAAELKRLMGLADPVVLHGRSAIGRFWNESMRAGLKDLRAYEERGACASTSLAVDDDTVVVEGGFAFGGQLRGQIFSETWVRTGEEWKLRSMMLAIQELVPGAAAFGAPATSPGTAKEALPAATLAPAPGAAPAPAKGGVGVPLLLLVIFATCGVAGVLLRRTRRRREAAIAGFEAMLG